MSKFEIPNQFSQFTNENRNLSLMPPPLSYGIKKSTSDSAIDTKVYKKDEFDNQESSRATNHPNAKTKTKTTTIEKKVDNRLKRNQLALDFTHTDWIDDFHIPSSVLDYKITLESSQKKFATTATDLSYSFTPRMFLKEIELPELRRVDLDPSLCCQLPENTNSSNQRDETLGAFSGYFCVPRLIVNVPNNLKGEEDKVKYMKDIPKICYHNKFDLEDSMYFFGGLHVSRFTTFKHLGIPSDTPVSQIKVYFPYELPPFVNAKLLTSPLMSPHPYFLQYNATRGSVTYLDTSFMKDFPGRFCCMSSTRISKNHFFFYGGFEIKNKSIDYDTDTGFWVIEKELIMNEDGYVIDTLTMKFSKIRLMTNNNALTIGRTGMGICSNVYEPTEGNYRSYSLHEPYSPNLIFESTGISCYSERKDISKLQEELYNNAKSDDKEGESIVRSASDNSQDSDTSPNTTANTAETAETTATATSTSTTSTSAPMESNRSTAGVPSIATFISTTANTSASTESSTTVSTDATHHRISPKLYPQSSVDSYHSIDTANLKNSSGSGSSSTASFKLSNVFSKSGSIFRKHRDHPLKTPHPLRVTYSDSTKKRLLDPNSSSAKSSRATSPLSRYVFERKSPKATSPERLTATPMQTDSSTFKSWNSNMAYRSASKSQSPISLKSGVPPGKPDVGSDHTMEGKNESLDLPPSIKTTTSPEPRRFVSRQSANFDESNDFLRTGTRSPELMCSSAATASSCNPLFRPPSDISIFIFGGFILDEPEEVDYSDKKVSKFKASNDLLKIDLKASQKLPFLNAINFADEALMVKVGSDKSCDLAIEENEIWPSPRGYFACTLVNYLVGVEACSRDVSAREGELTGVKKPEPSKYVPMKESSSQDSSQIEKFFDDRAFIIQGGCTENNQIYGDFYRFAFKTCKWEKVITYAYDHYNIPINTDDDEVANMLTKGNEIKNPELKEAEFRCCHHTALHYRNEERDYVFIIGGVKNTHLRLYNHEQYISDKIDVSRLAALLLTTTNPNLLRVGVLNTQTQTWRFMRYSNDMAGALTCAPVFDSYLESARIAHIGGTASINGKIITLAQGLASISPNKKADIEYLKEDFPIEELLFGGYVQFTFPGL